MMGLMDAIRRFRPDSGFRLSTYATWWIRQSARRAASGMSALRCGALICCDVLCYDVL
jgi:DNA-directed RNA polymerase sigma subunit (sigma70/sigma32)